MLVASVRKIVKDSLYFLKLNMGRTFLHFNLFPHKFLLKYISNFFPHSIVTNKELFGIIYSINSFFKSRYFFRISVGFYWFCCSIFLWNNPCSHSVPASCLRNLCILCQLPFSIISRLKIPKFYSSPSYGGPPPHTFLIILFSHTCIVWFLSKEIDLGSIFISVSNMLSVNGHYYSWPFWM